MKAKYDLYVSQLSEREFFEFMGMIGGFIVTQKFESPLLSVHKKLFEWGMTQLTDKEKTEFIRVLKQVGELYATDSVNLDLIKIGAQGLFEQFKNKDNETT